MQASRPKTPTDTTEEERKKEDGDEHMDADDAPVADKDKDATGGHMWVEAWEWLPNSLCCPSRIFMYITSLA